MKGPVEGRRDGRTRGAGVTRRGRRNRWSRGRMSVSVWEGVVGCGKIRCNATQEVGMEFKEGKQMAGWGDRDGKRKRQKNYRRRPW
jgi:hypothetical protein